MKDSTIFLICLAFLAAIVALSSSAFAGCSSCTKEGDWTQSANAFLEGKPINDQPVDFGPKAARKADSQFEKSDDTKASDSSAEIILKSINATPDSIEPNDTAKITVVFGRNGTGAEDENDLQITATAAIKDSNGKEVQKLNLIRSSANEYFNNWDASVPTGVYSVDISASSLEGSARFADALLISVKSPVGVLDANSTETASAALNSS
jgi:hypothetical protein